MEINKEVKSASKIALPVNPGPWDPRRCRCGGVFVPGTRRSKLCAKCDPSAPREHSGAEFRKELRGGIAGVAQLNWRRRDVEREQARYDGIALAFRNGGCIPGWEVKREGAELVFFNKKENVQFKRPAPKATKKAA